MFFIFSVIQIVSLFVRAQWEKFFQMRLCYSQVEENNIHPGLTLKLRLPFFFFGYSVIGYSVKYLVDKQKLSACLTGMNTTVSIWLGNNSFEN